MLKITKSQPQPNLKFKLQQINFNGSLGNTQNFCLRAFI